MTIRYEANPPKVSAGGPAEDLEAVSALVGRIKSIAGCCDAVHLTEDVLGFRRASPVEVGRILRREVPGMPVTVSLRVRDKTEAEVDRIVDDCVGCGFAGILVIMGDPPRDGRPDSGQVPSRVVRRLRGRGVGSRIGLYLSVPTSPDPGMIRGKVDAGPRGFMTQVVQSAEQAEGIAAALPGFQVIPIVMFPSEKNEASARLLGVRLSEYRGGFAELVDRIHGITGDLLITSPRDFGGVREFFRRIR